MADRVLAASLILDLDLYPRHSLDATNVRALIDALAAGTVLPPVVADRATRRLIDGAHRQRAVLRHYGGAAEIDCEWLDGLDDAGLFLEAARRNASHGRKLAAYDVARCYVRGQELGIDPALLATACSLTRERLADLGLRKTALVSGAGPTPARAVPIKRTLGHLAGRTLTEAQVEGNSRAGGLHVAAYVAQLRNALQHDLIDWTAPGMIDNLRELAHQLEEALATYA
jgi:hypothetical protein